MRSFRMSVGLIPAVFLAITALAGTALMATPARAQNPGAFTSDIRPIMERSSNGPVSTCVPGIWRSREVEPARRSCPGAPIRVCSTV